LSVVRSGFSTATGSGTTSRARGTTTAATAMMIQPSALMLAGSGGRIRPPESSGAASTAEVPNTAIACIQPKIRERSL
jgi:hypothetical protein